ncbi:MULTISPECIES: DUF2782 domain-containing protein [unclassified Halorhodospira]|uniref:DUF2782 domain-containing protein n=1 Tax=unclassified Halorhodospira TaxID=2626748 RepID=UPI001EE78330|nr:MULTISPECIES: DUF2782 domain-containing protein [unclassified Halorhodospira]MCG5540799.1 DUF2782 domain-containing protein [Halorhodospira sp. M39old]MCG5546039.1 DUF2782 domain-containing protein [Halorhodospira sp. M38]
MSSSRGARGAGGLVLAGMLVAATAGGFEADERITVTPPPPPEGLIRDEPDLEPTVTIVERDWAVIEEYRIAGQIYAVRIQPAVGPPYLLYDTTGDGVLDGSGGEHDPLEPPRTPLWRLFSW